MKNKKNSTSVWTNKNTFLLYSNDTWLPTGWLFGTWSSSHSWASLSVHWTWSVSDQRCSLVGHVACRSAQRGWSRLEGVYKNVRQAVFVVWACELKKWIGCWAELATPAHFFLFGVTPGSVAVRLDKCLSHKDSKRLEAAVQSVHLNPSNLLTSWDFKR